MTDYFAAAIVMFAAFVWVGGNRRHSSCEPLDLTSLIGRRPR